MLKTQSQWQILKKKPFLAFWRTLKKQKSLPTYIKTISTNYIKTTSERYLNREICDTQTELLKLQALSVNWLLATLCRIHSILVVLKLKEKRQIFFVWNAKFKTATCIPTKISWTFSYSSNHFEPVFVTTWMSISAFLLLWCQFHSYCTRKSNIFRR